MKYQIRLRGHLDKRWGDWFAGFQLEHIGSDTLLEGTVPDQAALHGVLAKIRDLGMPILLVEHLERRNEMINRKLFFMFFIVFFGVILPSCRGIKPEVSTILTQKLPDDSIRPSSATEEISANFMIRQSDSARMNFVPGSTFPMGSTATQVEDAIRLCQQHYNICNRWYYERESPQHLVSVEDFWIDGTEISNARYRLCVEAGICNEPTTCKKGEPTYVDPEKAEHPVVCVSWDDAQTYCDWAGARLLSEAEWEYAYRGEIGSIFTWGNEFDGQKLNYCDVNCSQSHADEVFDDGFPKTAPVGSFPQGISWSGALNMSGNVSEWVADWSGDFSSESVENLTGTQEGGEKTVKGCSWFFHPTYCRGAARHSVDPETRFDYLGFRCAESINLEHLEKDDLDLDTMLIPTRKAPVLDGTLANGEWEGAVVDNFSDGSELLMMKDSEHLYLGIRANTSGMIGGNIFTHAGNEISIFHISAALGTALYLNSGGDAWEQVQDFQWACRSTSHSKAAQAERDAFLLEEGWVAANSRMGTPNELEVQIKITEANLNLAVAFLRASEPNRKIPWPPDLEDDTIVPTPDGLPAIFHFSPEMWGVIDLTGGESAP